MSTAPREPIVLIDDDTALLDGLRRRLSMSYEVTTFSDPTAALTALCDLPAFGVVVSDMRMPGMDGLTLLRQVRRYFPESVCLVLTGDGDQELAVQAVNDGHIFRFLKKPCSIEHLRQAIDEAFAEYRNRLGRSGFLYRLVQGAQGLSAVEVEAGCRAVTGRSGVDFVRRPQQWFDLTLPEDAAAVSAFYSKAWTNQTVEPLEYRIRRADHTVVWVRNTLLDRRPEHSGICLCGQIQDITESKQSKMNLERATRRYEKIVANVPGLVFQAMLYGDGAFKFTFVSHSCLELLGVTAEQIYADSRLFFERFAAADRAQFYGKLAESADRLTPLVWQGCHTVGGKNRYFQGSARPERLSDGRVLWDGLLVDITEQKNNEFRAAFLAQISKDNPNPVLRVNPDGRIIYANDASQPLLALWDRDIGQILPQEIYEIALQVRQSAAIHTHEVRCNDRYFAIVFARISGSDDINLYARDVTEAKIAEMELRKANAELVEHDRLKSEFITTVTHEIRTPLCIFQNILSNALAGVHGAISPKLKENLQMAQQGVERLSRIVSDFLDISKIEAGSMKLDWSICSLNEVVEETCRSLKLLAAAKKIRIHTAMPSKQVFAWIDRDRIIQVLVNLIGNAIKFIPMRGRIDVILEQTESELTIRVKDDGPGLSPEEVRRVFDRFVQFKITQGPGQHGTGLGLAISRELVRMHGGQIGVESQLGHGCVFWFTIPRYDPNNLPQVAESKLVQK